MDVMVPRMKPVSPYTWELRALLPAAVEETARIPLELPGPSIICGCRATVIQTTNNGLLVPSIDDVLVYLNLDFTTQFTSADRAQGQTTAAGRSAQYVTLSALDTEFRDLYIDANTARPDIGATFRWKNFNAALYEDAAIGLAFFVLPK